jgi:hypothetical protein
MEPFVGEKETKKIISNTFITLSFVIVGLILTALLFWAYIKTDKLYITIFSFIVFAYTLMMVIFIALIRAKLTENEFKIYMSTSIFMSIFSLIVFGIFLTNTLSFFRNYSYTYRPPQGQVPMVGQPQMAAPPAYGQPQQPFVSPSLAAYNAPQGMQYVNPRTSLY